jgi:hypothetical protein
MIAAAVLAATACFDVTPGQAEGWRQQPWCAVIEYDEDATWDCSYRTFAECYPNVIAGTKGFCNLNPRGPGPSQATPALSHKPRKRHAQH